MPKSMPKEKRKAQFIDNELSKKCKLLLDVNDKLVIASETGFSFSYINHVIAGSRYNEKVIESLSEMIRKKIKELAKDEL